jgi:hypothetical protein
MKHRRFQIHLSTAIVLTCAAGGLSAINARPRSPSLVINGSITTAYHPCFGYPFGFLYAIPKNVEPEATPLNVLVGGVIINLLFAFSVLFMISLFCESVIRRREAKVVSDTSAHSDW